MKSIKFLVTLIMIVLLSIISTYVSAIIITTENKEVKPGEEFIVEIKVDESTVLANSHINYDSNIFEFKGTTQNNLSANEVNSGDIAWMYTEMNGNSTGVKSFEFKFKAKDNISKKQDSTFKLSDLAIITNSNQYEQNDITGNKEFKVIVNAKSGGLFTKILIVIIIIVVIFVFINILKSKKKKHWSLSYLLFILLPVFVRKVITKNILVLKLVI